MASKATRRHILITGLPGVGKTTLIRKLAEEVSDLRPVGFFTEEIREGGVRVGFSLESLKGHKQILSHVKIPGPHRVGRYGVDMAGFGRFLDRLDLLKNPSPLIIMDEIGKMECFSSKFAELVTALLDSPKQVVATIALKGGGLIQAVKNRSDVMIFEVKPMNRDSLLNELMTLIRRQLSS